MTLIKSISGIRGTIGGRVSENLTPVDVVKFTAAFTRFHQIRTGSMKIKLVVGRDARISGRIIEQLVLSTVASMGADVVNTGLSTTPTVEMAVTHFQADGGIILTASHNPTQWNALKLLNEKGEFLSDADGRQVLDLAEQMDFDYAKVDELGSITEENGMIDYHIEEVLKLPLVDTKLIREAGFKIVVDAVNSTGGMAIPQLLKALGVREIIELYCEPNGQFPHNPEPLPENLTEISKTVVDQNADLGIVVDPDVDRLAFVMEDGNMFGEEYTLVAVADYVLHHQKGNTVSNLSSTRALRDVTEKAGGSYQASAVGEVNVVDKMKETHAVIGGEGNGGVIYPALHYGRDALAGTALFLTHLAQKKMKMSELRSSYPGYFISKNKINLTNGMSTETVFRKVKEQYSQFPVTDIDGVKIDFPDGWVHLRASNTEPILRVYAESVSVEKAQEYARQVMNMVSQ
ncbi:MAG: phosphoglucosamine mutase [Bacteroidales bacterium]|nr:phosphoglucosamine mutase [Bacteroidales bacterium]